MDKKRVTLVMRKVIGSYPPRHINKYYFCKDYRPGYASETLSVRVNLLTNHIRTGFTDSDTYVGYERQANVKVYGRTYEE